MKALLSTTYFGPVQWYQKLCRYDEVIIERHEFFQKQTYRNRCNIATTNGVQSLTVPVKKPAGGDIHHTPTGELQISDHGNWRHIHWHALMSAYNESPFFEYYADDLLPFFQQRWSGLFDFNMAICRKVCELLDINPNISVSETFTPMDDIPSDVVDFRNTISPKHPLDTSDFSPKRYYQVYERKIGFRPNLSILDFLFNMGTEGLLYLY